MPSMRSGDFLLATLGLAATRDLFRAEDQVVARAAEMRHVIEHADQFPFDVEIELDEHDVVAGYTEWSASYDAPGTNPAIMLEESLTDPILAAAPRGRALDVACGTGRQVARLEALGHTVSGIDVTPAMVELARRRCPDARLAVGDWHDLPYDDGSFDLVTTALALCHAVELGPPVAEMARVLRSGGRLVISDMHPTFTALGGAAGYPGDRLGHLPFVRNHLHQLSDYFGACTGAGLDVCGLAEARMPAEMVRFFPTYAVFPEAAARAFSGAPTIVALTAVRPR